MGPFVAVSVFGPSCVLFGYTASQLTGLAPPVVGPAGRAFLYGGGCPGLARWCRYAGCHLGTIRAAQSVRLTPLAIVARLHYRNRLMRAQTTDPGRGKSVPDDRGGIETAARDDEQRVMS